MTTLETLKKIETVKEDKSKKDFFITVCLVLSITVLLIQIAFVSVLKGKLNEIIEFNDSILNQTNQVKTTLLNQNRLYADYIMIDISGNHTEEEREKLKKEKLEEIKKRR